MSDEQVQQEEQPLDPMQELTRERDEYKLSWQRALADYQNLQKETASRRAELASMSEQYILEEFIPVYDNFKKAFAQQPQTEDKQVKNWVTGIGFIMKQFADVMKAHNVKEIETLGKQFDPKFHEAVGEEASDKKPGTIVKEADGGYTMGDRVIKVAKVIISK